MKASTSKQLPLNDFLIYDLRRLAIMLGHSVTAIQTRAELIELLRGEEVRQVTQAIEKIVASNLLGKPDDMGDGDDQDRGISSPDYDAIMDIINQMKAGISRFGESMDGRMSQMETNVERVLSGQPLVIRVENVDPAGQTTVNVEGVVHKSFENMLKMAQAGVNILMVGPAGSGKTTAAEMVSRALGRKFYFNGAIDTEYKLKGFVDAQSRVIRTAFREAFEHGGVYLFDEVDASQPAATMAFNSALANGWCDFPDGRITRHKDTVIIAAANTFLGGATFEYVGRNKQDAAFIDRFVTLNWDYDNALEMALCPRKDWCEHVQSLRAKAQKLSLKVIISPRASFEGAKMLGAGLDWDFVEKSAVRKGMTEDQWKQISSK